MGTILKVVLSEPQSSLRPALMARFSFLPYLPWGSHMANVIIQFFNCTICIVNPLVRWIRPFIFLTLRFLDNWKVVKWAASWGLPWRKAEPVVKDITVLYYFWNYKIKAKNTWKDLLVNDLDTQKSSVAYVTEAICDAIMCVFWKTNERNVVQ